MKIVLPRQTTIYTCGAACLAAVSRLMGGASDEKVLATSMNAKPVVGIDNGTLWRHSEQLGADAHGENLYDGQKLSILNILNPISSVGHYVVALRTEKSGDVIVYCPYYANTIRLTKKWLEDNWISGDSAYKRWSITFPHVLDDNIVCVGEEWPEMGLSEGECNPHWLLRSANRFLRNVSVSDY